MDDIFCSTFCNQGHRVNDGKPVDHECYVLPPAALKAEREGDYAQAQDIMASEAHSRRPHRGVKLTAGGTS